MTRSENKLEGDLNIDVQNQYKDIAHMEKNMKKKILMLILSSLHLVGKV